MLKVGIVGLPNVGKSSLFNALTSAGAPSENYPFCTVDPNVGTVEVPDTRLQRIHEATGSARIVPTVMQFVDIAGLVKGASEGEGLGNQFLANIREVDAIAHVLRCFDDSDVAHVAGSVDPLRDREIVDTELALADLETVERRLDKVTKKAKSGDKEAKAEEAALRAALEPLSEGKAIRLAEIAEEHRVTLQQFQLLTAKPVLYVANVGEEDLPEGRNAWTEQVERVLAEERDGEMVSVCSAIESELAELEVDERDEFLADLGLDERGLDRFIRGAYHLLGLITYFTTGEKESRAWTVRRGAKAPEAAGVIHSDFEKGFIRAETIGYEAFLGLGSMKECRDKGLIRSEGKEYVVKDGDILLFRFNV
ncbi:MAG: redox-regulated ATPase YchF [Gemmatimonadota bacterium]|nr:redox-regulated ATPase YchF [Gemmatimonadota bacterium]MDH5758174.1 redox-regulated ATPase YchF [Gemmatimonadota bacterium]